MADICPYYQIDYSKCAFYGSLQEEYQREKFCLTKDKWASCLNYTNSSYNEKMSKQERTNSKL